MLNNNQNYFDFSIEKYLMLTTNSNNSESIDLIIKNLDLNASNICKIDQVHSNKVLFVDKPGYYGKVDGLITTNKHKIILYILTADCIPVFIFDKSAGIYALIHAGWRGIVNKIHYNAIDKICSLGSKSENINIFLGPSIRKCCFEIKDDIIHHFNKKYVTNNRNKKYIDLSGLIIDQFKEVGIKENNINYSPICTYDNEMCYSYRRNLTNDRMYSIMSYK